MVKLYQERDDFINDIEIFWLKWLVSVYLILMLMFLF